MESASIFEHFKLDEMKNLQNKEEIVKLSDVIEEIYYTNYKAERNELLKTNILNLLKILDENLQQSNSLTKDEISFLYCIKSQSLDKLPEYSKQSEDSASKSVSKIIIYNFIYFS